MPKPPTLWQKALDVMRLRGVADPAAVARRNRAALRCHWLHPGRLANRLALQRCLGLSAAQAYERHAGYMAERSMQRLAGRLLFLEHFGLLPLPVEGKAGMLAGWRWQHSAPPHQPCPGEPPLISLRDVARAPDSAFAALLLVAQCGGLPVLLAFQAGLPRTPAWQRLWAQARAEAARLEALLCGEQPTD